MRAVWLACGIFCLFYYLVIAVYAGPDADFAWFWPALSAACLLMALRGYAAFRQSMGPAGLYRVFGGIVLAGLVLIASFAVPVVRGMHLPEPQDLDYVIVLGAQVKKTRPSRALKRRLDSALHYAQSHPGTKLVLSGGQGPGEEISEAECMRRYLQEQGMEAELLILEDRSTTTRENLIFSDRLTGCSGKRCGILSNDFHVFRALMIAKSLGYKDPQGITASGDAVMELHYVVRESCALIIEFVRRIAG